MYENQNFIIEICPSVSLYSDRQFMPIDRVSIYGIQGHEALPDIFGNINDWIRMEPMDCQFYGKSKELIWTRKSNLKAIICDFSMKTKTYHLQHSYADDCRSLMEHMPDEDLDTGLHVMLNPACIMIIKDGNIIIEDIHIALPDGALSIAIMN